jgi:hypothetical protein
MRLFTSSKFPSSNFPRKKFPSNKLSGNKSLALAASLLCSACIPTTDQRLAAKADSMTACEKVNVLIASYSDGFQVLQGQRRSTRYGDMWIARYDVVGKGCEVWRLGDNSTYYVCNRIAPDQETAAHYYDEARELLHSCLGPDWRETEAPRSANSALKTVFATAATKATFSVRAIKTEGLFKQQWSVYYWVGDQHDQL